MPGTPGEKGFLLSKEITFDEAKSILNDVEDVEVVFEDYEVFNSSVESLNSANVSQGDAIKYINYLDSGNVDYLLDTHPLLMPLEDFGELSAEIIMPYEQDSQALTYNIQINRKPGESEEFMMPVLNIGGTIENDLTQEEAREYLEKHYDEEHIREGLFS